MNADFLMRLDTKGIIEHTYFLNCHKEMKRLNSIHSILANQTSKQLHQALSTHTATTFDDFLINGVHFFAMVVPFGNQYLFFATESRPDKITRESYKHLLQSLIDSYDDPFEEDEDTTKFYYESMQKLNNDLMNKTREVERLNKKLNRANRLLNNRLVKDPLTGLVSRYQYADEMALMTKEHTDKFGIFCFIDIDDFKPVNDTYGHKTGDVYLKTFADRLRTLPFDPSIIMRIAGDEFGVFIGGLDAVDASLTESLWETITDHVSGPISIEGHDHPLSFSLGMAVYNDHTKDIHELIEMADKAMYKAKETGNTYSVYKKEG